MRLKRQYDDKGECNGVLVMHTGTTPEQNFSTDLVATAQAQGWMAIDGDKLKLKSACGAELLYTVRRTPGYYCCHDGAPIPISAAGWMDPRVASAEARAYLKANGFEGRPSPDAGNPAGYCRINAYECVLDASQHEQFKIDA
jgi:hypothetical protein